MIQEGDIVICTLHTRDKYVHGFYARADQKVENGFNVTIPTWSKINFQTLDIFPQNEPKNDFGMLDDNGEVATLFLERCDLQKAPQRIHDSNEIIQATTFDLDDLPKDYFKWHCHVFDNIGKYIGVMAKPVPLRVQLEMRPVATIEESWISPWKRQTLMETFFDPKEFPKAPYWRPSKEKTGITAYCKKTVTIPMDDVEFQCTDKGFQLLFLEALQKSTLAKLQRRVVKCRKNPDGKPWNGFTKDDEYFDQNGFMELDTDMEPVGVPGGGYTKTLETNDVIYVQHRRGLGDNAVLFLDAKCYPGLDAFILYIKTGQYDHRLQYGLYKDYVHPDPKNPKLEEFIMRHLPFF